MLIGLVVGTGIGLLAAYLSTSLVSAGPGTAGESLVPVLFIFPLEALLLLVLAPAAMLLTSFAVTIRIARMDIARVLKLRGGRCAEHPHERLDQGVANRAIGS